MDGTQISSGLIEIDEELMWVTSISGNTLTVTMRGAYGTTAATHAAGAFVRNSPRFPRESIKRAINDVIRSTYPDLFAVASTELTAAASTLTYSLPSAVEDVLEVSWKDALSTGYWNAINRYRVNLNANATAYPTGKTIDILQGVLSGQTINVVYKKVPSVLSALTDLLTSSGLQESARETIVYGACSRLVGYLDPAMLQTSAAEAKAINGVDPSSMLNAARFFYQMHLQARAEEARRLTEKYPPRIHWTR